MIGKKKRMKVKPIIYLQVCFGNRMEFLAPVPVNKIFTYGYHLDTLPENFEGRFIFLCPPSGLDAPGV